MTRFNKNLTKKSLAYLKTCIVSAHGSEKIMRSLFFIVLVITLLSACSSSQKNAAPAGTVLLELDQPTVIGSSISGNIYMGGFSALNFIGKDEQGEALFLTLTDRGPNAGPLYITGVGKNARPFLIPEFQPRILKIKTNMKDKTLVVVNEIRLTDPLGSALSGRPQWPRSRDKKIAQQLLKKSDEVGVNLKGEALAPDLMGLDPEGLAIDSDGNFWVVEEYRPSILKFNSEGRLLKRYIPKGSLPKKVLTEIRKKYGRGIVLEALPEKLKDRRGNRGFEGIAHRNGKVYAIMQSPLENASAGRVAVVVEFDIKTEKTTAEYEYPFRHEGVEKIGDLAFSPGGELYAIEQNGKIGEHGVQTVTKLGLKAKMISVEDVFSLKEHGFDFAEKIEGLAFMSEKEFAVVNDNDFGVEGDFDLGKEYVPTGKKKTILGIFKLD